jgi:hypothetical protein
MRRTLLLTTTFLVLGAAGAAPAAASERSTYCSVSGDVCYGVVTAAPVRLRITLAAKYFDRFRLCVTGPDGRRDCRSFAVRSEAHGLFGATVRWSRSFPNRGHGTYRVRWLDGAQPLGPPVSFRRTGPPSIRVQPAAVRAGGVVRVTGYAGGCPAGDQVTLISKAFPHTHDFAGLPAAFATVQPNDGYSASVAIRRSRRPGRYGITARCGGGSFGVRRVLTVLATSPTP